MGEAFIFQPFLDICCHLVSDRNRPKNLGDNISVRTDPPAKLGQEDKVHVGLRVGSILHGPEGAPSARPVALIRIGRSVSDSPIRFLGVVDAPVVPHAHVRGAGVVADVALEQLLQNTIWDRKASCSKCRADADGR